MVFSFEKLDIYRKSLDFSLNIRQICKTIKTDYDILDQLKRAALSISLNIAEGAGRWHKKEKRNFYFIAKGSLFECIPIMKILYKEELISKEDYNSFYNHAEDLAKMLTKLIQSVS